LRFLTYNIRHAEGYDGWVSPARIAEVVRGAHPDVVGLNEAWRVSNVYDQADRVASSLGFSAARQGNARYLTVVQCNAVLTGGSIIVEEALRLPGGLERRGALVCELEVDGMKIAFASTHLSLGRRARSAQLAALAALLPRNLPLVLAGDFNCTADQLEPLREFLTVPSNPPSTFPAIRPSRGLDHIAFSAHWRLLETGTIRSLASDHLALWADLELV
jgi:endonuclease/exonuclease/phosphatase family metal-dependent hydrolase